VRVFFLSLLFLRGNGRSKVRSDDEGWIMDMSCIQVAARHLALTAICFAIGRRLDECVQGSTQGPFPMDGTLWLKLLWGRNVVNGVMFAFATCVHVMRAPNNLQGILVSVTIQNSPTIR